MLDAAAFPEIQPVVSPDARDHLGCYGIRPRQGWLVAQTHPQAERYADSNLRLRGYRTYLPLHAVRRRDRVVPSLSHTVLVPLFSRYCFVWHDSRDPRRPIRETPGVHDIIRNGSEASYASAGVVEALQATEAARRTLTPPDTLWRPGAACSLSHGALYGLPAVVTAVHAANDTATIAIMMLGHLRSVTVPLDCLRSRDDAQ